MKIFYVILILLLPSLGCPGHNIRFKLEKEKKVKSVKRLRTTHSAKDMAIRIMFTESSILYTDAGWVCRVIRNRAIIDSCSILSVCTSPSQFSGIYNYNFYHVPNEVYHKLDSVFNYIINVDTIGTTVYFFNNPKICGNQSYTGKLIHVSENNHHYYEPKNKDALRQRQKFTSVQSQM